MITVTKVKIDAGACKMITEIIANATDTEAVEIEILSNCPHVMKLSESIKSVLPYNEICNTLFNTSVYKATNETIPHPACPIPCGILKAIEVAGGLGIKKTVTIEFE